MGEEDESGPPPPLPEGSPKLRHDLCVDVKGELAEWSVPIEELTVFVDPLDGTREFVEGRLAAVQSLVGVAWRGRAVAGAVGLPFSAGASDAPPAVAYAVAGAGDADGKGGARAAAPSRVSPLSAVPGRALRAARRPKRVTGTHARFLRR